MWKEHYTACQEEPGRPTGTPATEGRAGKGRSPGREPEPGPRVREQRIRESGKPRPEQERGDKGPNARERDQKPRQRH